MTYSIEFFRSRREKTLASAQSIVDHIWETIQPKSVLDVGCATGIWLSQARRRGVQNIRGIDGPWVPQEELEIEKKFFIEHDLSETNPTDIGYYDLAMCIEVAEHLPQEAADRFIDFLTSHADVILFSAAIPGQGGTGHLNEQPQSFWYNKFADRHFDCFDIIRPIFWNDPVINVIYKQNMLVYVRTESSFHKKLLESEHSEFQVTTKFQLDRIHPYLFELRISPKNTVAQKIKKKLKLISSALVSKCK